VLPKLPKKNKLNLTLPANAGDKKINVIKVVREITKLGLKEAKDLETEPQNGF
jgi:large subunit ribosomal protein L7/L12